MSLIQINVLSQDDWFDALVTLYAKYIAIQKYCIFIYLYTAVVKSLHKLIMGMDVMVIFSF